MVMAGTGNLELLRRLRKLHHRLAPDISYGNHMATQMSLGLLFLGGGEYTLSTSNKAIAALFCAFYPQFPDTVGDNRSHLQAFRHLWVLAVDARCLVTRDVENNDLCAVPITVTIYTDAKQDSINQSHESILDIDMTTPCLLPEFHLIKKIKSQTPRYWPVCLDFEINKKHFESLQVTGNVLFVKRRIGHLTYFQVW